MALRALLPVVGLAGALYILVSEKPPPIWRERCVAWKDAGKDDCSRCCAAFGENYFTPKAMACVLICIQLARIGMFSCCCTPTTPSSTEVQGPVSDSVILLKRLVVSGLKIVLNEQGD